jgi:hypothetical protein
MHGVFADDDRDRGRRPARRDPVTPADDEARVIAEAAADEDVLTAGAGERRELGERVCAEERVERAGDPDGDVRPESVDLGGDDAGRAENARADGVADGDGKSEPDSEDGKEMPTYARFFGDRHPARQVYPETRSGEGSSAP